MRSRSRKKFNVSSYLIFFYVKIRLAALACRRLAQLKQGTTVINSMFMWYNMRNRELGSQKRHRSVLKIDVVVQQLQMELCGIFITPGKHAIG